MIIYLQNRVTKDVADSEGHWTATRELACQFNSGHEALAFRRTHDLHHAQVGYGFPNRRMDFALPINEVSPGILSDRINGHTTSPKALAT